MNPEQDFVMKTIKSRDVHFVRLWFTDVLGTMKSFAVSPSEIEGAFMEGMGFRFGQIQRQYAVSLRSEGYGTGRGGPGKLYPALLTGHGTFRRSGQFFDQYHSCILLYGSRVILFPFPQAFPDPHGQYTDQHDHDNA